MTLGRAATHADLIALLRRRLVPVGPAARKCLDDAAAPFGPASRAQAA